jgi:transcriptional regulator with XRE-family HTH domain
VCANQSPDILSWFFSSASGTLTKPGNGDETMLMIGERLRTIRESKNLSQGDIEQRTGMMRSYTSRVENGHTVPSIETLAKYAQALDIPLYQIFYDGEEAPKKIKGLDLDGKNLSLSERREIESLGRQFAKLKARDKGLVRLLVAKLAQSAL